MHGPMESGDEVQIPRLREMLFRGRIVTASHCGRSSSAASANVNTMVGVTPGTTLTML